MEIWKFRHIWKGTCTYSRKLNIGCEELNLNTQSVRNKIVTVGKQSVIFNNYAITKIPVL